MPALPALGLEHTYAEQLEGLYVSYMTQGFDAPEVVVVNEGLLDELGLDASMVKEHGAALFSGSALPTDARPLAQAYAGHQFGGFSPQLGDGRAVLLGERLDRHGRRRDLQLKGAGATPFSRGGDGKATIGPVLREYLIGEAMHHLGIPTTRGLAAVRTGEPVMRSGWLPGAVLARVASSHLRVGTLQFFAARQDHEKLRRLVDYSLARHYPDRVGQGDAALELMLGVAEAQGRLIAQWMGVGFIHGVMNTDNTTLSGETIDYGPCAFLDVYDPTTVFSSIDHGGRYAFGNQPAIGQWNLARMGEALLPLLHDDADAAVERVHQALHRYVEVYQASLLAGMGAKLGLEGTDAGDAELVAGLLAWMEEGGHDFTLTFRRLAEALAAGGPALDVGAVEWHGAWLARLGAADRAATAARMNQVNPLYIPRNHKVEEALDGAIAGDMGPFHRLLDVLSSPFTAREAAAEYATAAPDDFGPYQTFCGT